MRTTEEGSKQQLSIFPRSSGWIDVVFIYEIDSKVSTDGITVMTFEGYNTSLNGQKFVCLRLRGKDHNWSEEEVKKWPFSIFYYETPSNRKELVIKPFSTQKVEELITEGRLKGEVAKGDVFAGRPFDNVIVTSSAEELMDVISKEGVAAFIGQGTYDVLVFSRGVAH